MKTPLSKALREQLSEPYIWEETPKGWYQRPRDGEDKALLWEEIHRLEREVGQENTD